MGSRAGGAQDAPEGPDHHDSSIAVVGDEWIPALDTTTTVKATTAGDPAVLAGPTANAPSSPPQMVAATGSGGADGNALEEPKVIMWHPGLRAPGLSPSLRQWARPILL
jgi:hypothetical protein